MIDRRIAYCNVLMRCDEIPTSLPQRLPPGYTFAAYTPGREQDWAALETEIGDFESVEQARAYFEATYLPDAATLGERCFFVLSPSGEAVASCMAWRDEPAASLHWLVTSPRYERQGIGRALVERCLALYRQRGEGPVYLHTQPWSYPAIGLYGRLGFALLKTDSFAHYENEFGQACTLLRELLPEACWAALVQGAK